MLPNTTDTFFVYVETIQQSHTIQNIAFKCGYEWCSSSTELQNYENCYLVFNYMSDSGDSFIGKITYYDKSEIVFDYEYDRMGKCYKYRNLIIDRLLKEEGA
jgi:hypothetical protein